MNPPNLPISIYSFTFRALQPIVNTDFSASLWHGQFGRALRETVKCVQPHSECKQCMLLHHCDYALLFYGARPSNTKIMRKYDTIPVPHAFHGEITQPMKIQKNALFSIKMSLVGSTIKKLPTIIESMENMGRQGFEKQRFKATLNSVSIQHQEGEEELLYANGLLLSLSKEYTPIIPKCPSLVRLQWRTPYRDRAIKGRQKPMTLNIAKLMMAIIRRISLLQNFYTSSPLETDFIHLKELSKKLESSCLTQSLLFSQHRRYSAKHKAHLPTSGVLGYLDLSLKGVESLWPYLFLGQFLNVGQNASMGFGQYKILTVNMLESR